MYFLKNIPGLAGGTGNARTQPRLAGYGVTSFVRRRVCVRHEPRVEHGCIRAETRSAKQVLRQRK